MTKPRPLDMTFIERGLLQERYQPGVDQEWLRASHARPEIFWSELAAWHDTTLAVRTKSAPGQRYDCYHDLVLRNLQLDAPALRWRDLGLEARNISYRELGILASRRAAAWRRAGVEAGQVVCVIRPLGLELVVSLVAALKLGMVVSLLPPQGRAFLSPRLAALAPQYLDTDEIYRRLIADEALVVLPSGEPTDPLSEFERSFSYAAGSVAALLFDPTCDTPAVPRPVTADALYLGAVRDGALALGLRPGDAYAAPGFHLLETQPAMLLAGMFMGATFLHLELDQLEREPRLLAELPVRVLGVTAAVRDLVVDRAVSLGERSSTWFRDPALGTSSELWERFVEVAGLQRARSMNLRWNAASGGCVLFSRRSRGLGHYVFPAAGAPFFLADIRLGDVESMTGHGRLASTPPGAEDASATADLLVTRTDEWIRLGSSALGRQGRHYPVDEVLAVLADLDGACRGASICSIPAADGQDGQTIALLLFTGAAGTGNEAELLRLVRQRIDGELGEEFRPDRVHCFPLVPRRDKDGAIDHVWVRDQYLSGNLARKSRDELYRSLSALREALAIEKESTP